MVGLVALGCVWWFGARWLRGACRLLRCVAVGCDVTVVVAVVVVVVVVVADAAVVVVVVNVAIAFVGIVLEGAKASPTP